MPERVVEIVGVYAADGGLRGELAYVVGHLLGRAECALCDVTHGTLRRKPEWDAMTARLRVPLRLVHRNETSDAERTASELSGLPVVLGVRPDGSHAVMLGPTTLAGLGASVGRFEEALLDSLSRERAS